LLAEAHLEPDRNPPGVLLIGDQTPPPRIGPQRVVELTRFVNIDSVRRWKHWIQAEQDS